MNVATQQELLRRFFALRDEHSTTLAPSVYRQQASVYTDPVRLDAEIDALFRGQPLVVGLSADLPSTGDVMATEVSGVPLLLVRGEDASVRAFLNICRHRGGRVVRGRGRPGRALKCPYHSWAYDLNGDLLGQPLARDAFAELDRSDFGLVPVPVGERYGVIMASIGGSRSGRAVDVAAALGDVVGTELGEYGFERFRFFDERHGVFDANWKLIHDTFLEAYHVFSLHRDTLAGDLLSTPFVGDFFGDHGRGIVMRREVVELLELPVADWRLRRYASIVYLLFPSVILNLPMSGHAELWEIYPEGRDPNRTRVSVRFYVPIESSHGDDFWDANVRFTHNVVFEEDFAQQQDIHRSLCTGLMAGLVYGRNEPALIHHHQRVEAALRARHSSRTLTRET